MGGAGGLGPLWILKILEKEVCVLGLEWEKQISPVLCPLETIWKNPLVPPGKNPSDAHGRYVHAVS